MHEAGRYGQPPPSPGLMDGKRYQATQLPSESVSQLVEHLTCMTPLPSTMLFDVRMDILVSISSSLPKLYLKQETRPLYAHSLLATSRHLPVILYDFAPHCLAQFFSPRLSFSRFFSWTLLNRDCRRRKFPLQFPDWRASFIGTRALWAFTAGFGYPL